MQSSVDPGWREYRLPDSKQLTALLPGDGVELWVLADARRRATGRDPSPVFRVGEPPEPKPKERDANAVPVVGHQPRQDLDVVSHVLLWGRELRWTTEARLLGDLRTIARLKDGSAAAGGGGLLIRDDRGEWSAHSAPASLVRIWGVGPTCVYALGERGHGKEMLGKTELEAARVSHPLFYFDGRRWAEIDVGPGFFVDGACDADGRSWIVGTHSTHSCMATGKGTEWRRDGCSSWYLYRVHVDEGGQAFALGGDGLWRHEGQDWVEVGAFGSGLVFPLALSSVGGKPWVVTDQTVPGLRGEGPILHALDVSMRQGGEQEGPRGFGVFIGQRWVTVPAPEGFNLRTGASIALSPLGSVVVGQAETVWESRPLLTAYPLLSAAPNRCDRGEQ